MTGRLHLLLALSLVLLALPPASVLGGETEVSTGQDVFAKKQCGTCHTVLAAGIGGSQDGAEQDEAEQDEAEQDDGGWGDDEGWLDEGDRAAPPDLSLAGEGRTAEWFDLYLNKKETVEGRKHIKKLKCDPQERVALIEWLLTLKAPGDSLGVQSLADTLGAEPPLGAEGQETE